MGKVKQTAGVFLPCLAGALYGLALMRAGAGAAGLLLFWLFALCGVWLPGRVLAEVFGARRQGLLQTASLVFGCGLLAAVTALASATGLHGLVWLLPALGLAGLAARRRKFDWRGRSGSRWPAALWAALLALTAFGCVLAQAHPASAWGGGAVLPDHDLYWNLGNVQSFLQGFPPADLRFAGTQLTYHWLTELLAAGFAMAGVPAYDALAFYLPAAVLAALAAVLAEFGRVWFGGSEKKTGLFVLLTFLGGSAALWKPLEGRDPFWNLFLRHLVTNINGVATGMVFLAAFAAALCVLSQTDENAGWLWALALGSFLQLALAKGPVAGVAALALLGAALARLAVLAKPGEAGLGEQHPCKGRPQTGCKPVRGNGLLLLGAAWQKQRPQARRALRLLALAAAVLALFLLCYALLFSAGAGTSVHFSARGTLEKSYFRNFLALLKARSGLAYAVSLPLFALAQTLCFAPFAALLGFGGAVRDVPRIFRLGLPRLFATAMAVGGFLAFFLFDHEAMSQMYFAFAGLFFLNALAVENTGALLAWLREKKPPARGLGRAVLAGALAVSLATGCCTCAWLVRDGLAPTRETEWDLPLTAAEEQAMAWFAENGGEFITNRIHTGRAREGLSNVYSGLSGRQGYMEGFKYAVSNMGVPIEEVLHRLDVLELVFGAETAQDVLRAVPPGVRYIVYSTRAAQAGWDVMEGRDEPFFAGGGAAEGLPLVFQNDDVSIYFVSEKTEDLP